MPVVRRAHVEDAAALARVHVASWQGAYRGLVPDEVLDSLDVEDWTLRKARHLGDGAAMWIADEGLGFAHAGRSRDDDGLGELYALYVHPERFGRGLGLALLRTVEAWLDDRYVKAELWVLTGNTRARRFYEAAGWYEVESNAKAVLGVELDVTRYLRDRP